MDPITIALVLKVVSTLIVTAAKLKAAADAIIAIAKVCGLFKEDVDPEEIGDKAIQAEKDGIKPENYKTYGEYMEAVEAYKADPKESAKISEEEKLKKGIELMINDLDEKYPNTNMGNMLLHSLNNPEYFDKKHMVEFGKLVQKDGATFNDVALYVNGKTKDDGVIKNALETLKGIEKNIDPEVSDREALQKAVKARN